MKYIKLFEAFNSNNLPNFRVELVKHGMKEGKYLFSMVDGDRTSYWGVFDLGGLRKLEEDMNTMCIIDELKMEIIWKGGNVYGPIDWAQDWTKIVVNKVPDNVKYLNLVEGSPDFSGVRRGFFPDETMSISADKSEIDSTAYPQRRDAPVNSRRLH